MKCVDHRVAFLTCRVTRWKVDAVANILINKFALKMEVLSVGREAGLRWFRLTDPLNARGCGTLFFLFLSTGG